LRIEIGVDARDNKAIVGRWFTGFWGKTCDLGILLRPITSGARRSKPSSTAHASSPAPAKLRVRPSGGDPFFVLVEVRARRVTSNVIIAPVGR